MLFIWVRINRLWGTVEIFEEQLRLAPTELAPRPLLPVRHSDGLAVASSELRLRHGYGGTSHHPASRFTNHNSRITRPAYSRPTSPVSPRPPRTCEYLRLFSPSPSHYRLADT